ncbi:cob(I)yrinic acid a,c-diamide adenosyltransferase [Nostocoides sp. F2B08]|uniref:cob(I)yrinic acid a,c-diamide adenosyltransferase n=1 Tax=Nostocoides sp. F2B08 TaxID=2653936 RepID=UPI001263DFD5|nr:cob(I)yrinic acid a,c-diamide adenosyltransferase [Tetrasphaera sp. F2B08]KAB7746155.1 cob(I)yrinic acid a,c-diamide adenosyltransferase [Tetrasphaera sp. F2B08]
MVNLTKIYTRTGDQGTTGLGDFSRVSKTDVRLSAYADTNEANAVIGVALTASGLGEDVSQVLRRVQNDLFDVGADLCMPLQEVYEYEPLRVRAEWIDELEEDCDRYLESLPPLRSFILPGGSVAAAHLHHALTVVRRAERSAWAAAERYGTEPATEKGHGGVNPLAATYLNRLSDLLFILARVANIDTTEGGRQGDVLWQPGGGRIAEPERRGRNRSARSATD